ncbi:MAG: TolC family protein [Myxococcales bacterium]|nr:TolC family protein [Myxococcales bacterium]MCB9520097.1 TolC family protein [Myxococcales bacterium]MCB9531823.1 TolC family protein [Myxococcales bacterium]
MARAAAAALVAALCAAAGADAQEASVDVATSTDAPEHAQPSPGIAQADEGQAVHLSLAELLERVEHASPLIGIADAEVERASMRRLEARYAHFPRLRFNVGVAPAPRVELETDPETGELDPFSNRQTDGDLLQSILGGAGLGVRGELEGTLPLTTFGKIHLARQLAELGIDVAEIQRGAAVAESRVQAYRAYLTVQWWADVDRLLREAARRLDEAESRLEDALDDGDYSARTSLRQLTIARSDFVELRTDADALGVLARFAIAEVTGLPRDFVTDSFDDTVPDDSVPQMDAVLAYARSHRPDAILLDAAVRASSLSVRTRYRALTPDLALVATVGGAFTPTVDDVSGPFINDPYNRFGFGFGFALQWSMNPASIVARARTAEAELAIAEASRDAGLLGIEADVVEAYLAAQGQHLLLVSRSDSRDAATAWLNQVSFQYDQGLADYDDLKDPLETYYRTSGEYLESLLRYRVALADLAMKCGADALDVWPAE